jgi:urease accessory protein
MMIELTTRLNQPTTAETTLTLPLESRVKSRLRATLDDGREVGLFLERGQVLREGDCLSSQDGTVVVIKAADEQLSSVTCMDSLMMAKACYHLGNRHVALQINENTLRYQHDHVLDDMVRGLGLEVTVLMVPFNPEPGAYEQRGSHDHHHHHSH